MTEIVADKTVEVVKNAIETADGALDLYNKYLDQVIPWQTFDETIKELSRFKQEYSQAASVLVGDIKTLLMDSQDKYFEATQTVYEWCGVATQLLAAYIFLFDEYNEKKASAQKDILIKVLDDPLHPEFLRRGDGQGTVTVGRQRALQQGDGVNAHCGNPRLTGLRNAAGGFLGHIFMGDGVQVRQGLLVLKDHRAQLLPVQGFPVVHRAKPGLQLRPQGGRGPGQIVVHGIGVNDLPS